MKRLCAKAALEYVPDHEIVGLGGGETINDFKTLDEQLKKITGVIETSLFYQVAAKAIVAGKDNITVMER